MKIIAIILGLLIPLFAAFAATPAHQKSIDRIAALEVRIEALEKKLNPLLQQQKHLSQARKEPTRARQRILADNDRYTRQELHAIEVLYNQAALDWAAPEAKQILQTLQNRFPKANRTGCAFLRYTLQLSNEEKIDQLQHLIQHYSSCYFPDGVHIGSFARLTLSLAYRKAGNFSAAEKQIDLLRQIHPHAIDHQGRLLLDHLDDLEAILPRP